MRTRLVWLATIALVALGVIAAAGRAVWIGDLGTRLMPLRNASFHALGLTDPRIDERTREVREFDAPYGAHPLATLLHVVPASLFIAAALLQFSARVRRRLQVHRVIGRIAVLCAIIAAASALFFGLLMPFAGYGERVAAAIFGVLLVTASVRGYLAIRSGDRASHREWMIRAFATAIAVSVVRIVDGVLDLMLASQGYTARELFLMSMWIGWIVTLAFTEMWIAATRPPRADAVARVG